ncbi:uncharacterized protein LOC132700965 [Cylas formicarius]|uniref:uncharacterized protein LOC132700965 n=1 Tax=Cylas formicarius TaxID=197179 RepID=UPI002958A9B4|nr:uncharacterized protein LOC132700965 [Cylas formicarius]
MLLKISVLVFGLYVIYARSDIDFVDCGYGTAVEEVLIENCTLSPCVVHIGEAIGIKMILDKVPVLDELHVGSYVTIFGQKFYEVNVFTTKPCIVECPLSQELRNASFDVAVVFGTNLVRRPAILIINTTYVSDGKEERGLCIEFEVDIF